jgi:hypothetical protein
VCWVLFRMDHRLIFERRRGVTELYRSSETVWTSKRDQASRGCEMPGYYLYSFRDTNDAPIRPEP